MKLDDQEAFPAGRLLAIGDIHGCSEALRALLDAITPQVEDTIVTLGDYVDRGPDSRGVLDLLIELASRCYLIPLLGNHEELLLAALESPSALRSWLKLGGKETLNSYGPDTGLELIPTAHLRFLKGCRDSYETSGHIFAHANYEPHLPIQQVDAGMLRWKPIEAREQRPHQSGKQIVVGHTPQVGGKVLNLGFLIGLDTNCSRGGWLSALNVHTGEVIRANQAGQVEGYCLR